MLKPLVVQTLEHLLKGLSSSIEYFYLHGLRDLIFVCGFVIFKQYYVVFLVFFWGGIEGWAEGRGWLQCTEVFDFVFLFEPEK